MEPVFFADGSIDGERCQVRFTSRRRGVRSTVKIADPTTRDLLHPAGSLSYESRKPERVAV